MKRTSNSKREHPGDLTRPPQLDRLLALLQGKRESAPTAAESAAWGLLTRGLPQEHFRSPATLSQYLFWCPNGFPPGKSTLLASSRIGNRPERKSGLFDAIRTVACRFDSTRNFLITHDATATHSYVERAAQLYGLPLVEFKPLPSRFDLNWLHTTWESQPREDNRKRVCYYHQVGETDSPQRDQLLMDLALIVRVLAVQRRGNCYRALMKRLQYDPHLTLLLVDKRLTSSQVAEQLCCAGAIRWWLYHQQGEQTFQGAAPFSEVFSLPQYASRHLLADYLFHWTRGCNGPWPDQSNRQYIDDLILGAPSSDHSRLATLCRIVAMRRLTASNEITRDSTPVVCFTEQTVERFAELRTFRSHLGRWDFELAGVAIKRDILERLGARPVIYGSDATWEQLEPSQRPFFQIERSNSGKRDITWTIEKEWRVKGNVDLDRLKPHDAFVFVETEDEAHAVAVFSRWPVVVIGKQT